MCGINYGATCSSSGHIVPRNRTRDHALKQALAGSARTTRSSSEEPEAPGEGLSNGSASIEGRAGHRRAAINAVL